MRPFPLAAGLLIACLATSAAAHQPAEPAPDAPLSPAARLLVERPPLVAADDLRELIDAGGADAQDARFALGVAQVLGAVEQLGRGLYELGPRNDTLVRGLPLLRLPVPENPDPPVVTIDDLNRLLERFTADLAAARTTLEAIEGEVSLTLPLTQLALDFDADGVTGEKERLGDVLFELRMINPRPTAVSAKYYVVDFDYADVQWLIAYTHLLSAMAEFGLAWDASELFAHAGHLLFQRTDSPYDFLRGTGGFNLSYASITDFAAFLHTARVPLRDPNRLENVRNHLLAAVEGSRRTMQLIQGERDRGREWIPGPHQSAALPNIVVTQEIIDSWLAFLDDAEAVLEGKRLIPFWRADDGHGLNLRRALAECRELDVVLWLQGTAAVPYLERDKPLASGESFRRMQNVTNGNFWTFAVWFN